MKILFNNLVWSAGLSSLHEDSTYPLSNLNHIFLKMYYKSTANADAITATFATVQDINCIYLGFTNATSISVEFRSYTGTLITTKTVSTTRLGHYFAEVKNVKSINVILSTGEDALYVGTIACGKAVGIGTMIHGFAKGFEDNSSFTESADGQLVINKKAWLKKLPIPLCCTGFDEYNEAYALISGIRRPIFIDVYEENDGAINPFYGIINLGEPSQDWRLFKYSVTLREKR